MAQKTQVILTDDMDGSEATQTIAFAFQGVNYEIDLNDDHASALEESFHDWIQAARKVSSKTGTTRGPRGTRSAGSPSTPGTATSPGNSRSFVIMA